MENSFSNYSLIRRPLDNLLPKLIIDLFPIFAHDYFVDQDESEFPLIEPLPSYGRGRDAPGGRYISLIFGINLVDVVITGNYMEYRSDIFTN